MSWDPAIRRQEAIETACHNAIRVMFDEAAAATLQQRSLDSRLVLAAALEAIERERTMPRLAVDALSHPFDIEDCIDHLRATAAPRRPA